MKRKMKDELFLKQSKNYEGRSGNPGKEEKMLSIICTMKGRKLIWHSPSFAIILLGRLLFK